MERYIVTAEESICSSSVEKEDGDWMDMKSAEVVLGTYEAENEDEAIDKAHADYSEINRDSLIARKLA